MASDCTRKKDAFCCNGIVHPRVLLALEGANVYRDTELAQEARSALVGLEPRGIGAAVDGRATLFQGVSRRRPAVVAQGRQQWVLGEDIGSELGDGGA